MLGKGSKRRVKVLAKLIETVLGHGRAGKSASAPEMLVAVMVAAALKLQARNIQKKYIKLENNGKKKGGKKCQGKKNATVVIIVFVVVVVVSRLPVDAA